MEGSTAVVNGRVDKPICSDHKNVAALNRFAMTNWSPFRNGKSAPDDAAGCLPANGTTTTAHRHEDDGDGSCHHHLPAVASDATLLDVEPASLRDGEEGHFFNRESRCLEADCTSCTIM